MALCDRQGREAGGAGSGPRERGRTTEGWHVLLLSQSRRSSCRPLRRSPSGPVDSLRRTESLGRTIHGAGRRPCAPRAPRKDCTARARRKWKPNRGERGLSLCSPSLAPAPSVRQAKAPFGPDAGTHPSRRTVGAPLRRVVDWWSTVKEVWAGAERAEVVGALAALELRSLFSRQTRWLRTKQVMQTRGGVASVVSVGLVCLLLGSRFLKEGEERRRMR